MIFLWAFFIFTSMSIKLTHPPVALEGVPKGNSFRQWTIKNKIPIVYNVLFMDDDTNARDDYVGWHELALNSDVSPFTELVNLANHLVLQKHDSQLDLDFRKNYELFKDFIIKSAQKSSHTDIIDDQVDRRRTKILLAPFKKLKNIKDPFILESVLKDAVQEALKHPLEKNSRLVIKKAAKELNHLLIYSILEIRFNERIYKHLSERIWTGESIHFPFYLQLGSKTIKFIRELELTEFGYKYLCRIGSKVYYVTIMHSDLDESLMKLKKDQLKAQKIPYLVFKGKNMLFERVTAVSKVASSDELSIIDDVTHTDPEYPSDHESMS